MQLLGRQSQGSGTVLVAPGPVLSLTRAFPWALKALQALPTLSSEGTHCVLQSHFQPEDSMFEAQEPHLLATLQP